MPEKLEPSMYTELEKILGPRPASGLKGTEEDVLLLPYEEHKSDEEYLPNGSSGWRPEDEQDIPYMTSDDGPVDCRQS